MDSNQITQIPAHVGIIMDGNGRWAKQRNKPRSFGHQEGAKRVIEIVEAAYQLGIQSLSLYAFSTENWKRPADEINKLMELLVVFIDKELRRLASNNVKINILGDISKLPPRVRTAVERALKDTMSNDKMTLNIGLNYGGRDEIVKAVQSFTQDVVNGVKSIDELTTESFKLYLDTANQPELDLLIRPSGELRVSNFMLYQLAYSEFWFSDVLWPDFTTEVFYSALADYGKRKRRFGGLDG
ncbi:isoprenyl transferase [Peptoniphilus equinus]|uniref:Isoprenyl transferase n=1 Tax=Peptoniphilus equinus TaxID=3016343 RepID=A0ABY7QWM2_9FIRM|nr:isoprenyl transferase [Peptoniphilus equinus]WBW50670.1 isoprenyl transferase [Peptoniphilus equinus]